MVMYFVCKCVIYILLFYNTITNKKKEKQKMTVHKAYESTQICSMYTEIFMIT